MIFDRRTRCFLATLRREMPALPLAAGVFFGQAFAWFSPFDLLVVGLFLLGLLFFVFRWVRGALVCGVCLGFVSAGAEIAGRFEPLGGADIQSLVRIEDFPAHRVPGEVTFIAQDLLGPGQRRLRCRAVDLPWRHASSYERGDVVWIRGKEVSVRRPLNPFSWDGWLWRRGISGEVRVMFSSAPVTRDPGWIGRIREWIVGTVRARTDDRRGGGLLLSMAFGIRDQISRQVEDVFSMLGLSHLLVVSGYQVSLVFGCIFSLLVRGQGLIAHRVMFRNAIVMLSLLFSFIYVAIIGMEMSAMRALVAATCVSIAFLFDRRQRFGQRWSVALMIMQVLSPWALFDVGVILTFAALAGIGVGSVLGAGSRVRSAVMVTIAVWLATSCVVVVWSGQFSAIGMVLNLLLSAPWSMLNCTVGVAGLLCGLVHMASCSYIVNVVSALNEMCMVFLFWIAEGGSGSSTFEGASRWLVFAFLFLGIARAIAVAWSRREALVMMSMVTSGGRQKQIRS